MAAYSQDLRQRILDAIQRNEGSFRQIARRFVVSLSFVVRLLQLHRRTGSIDPKPAGGGHPPALAPDDLERLQELVRQQPDATLKELPPAPRRLVQPHDHLARLGEVAAAAQEEGPARRRAGAARRSRRSGATSASDWPVCTRSGWSSSTRAEPTRR